MSTACVEYLARGTKMKVHPERFTFVISATYPSAVRAMSLRQNASTALLSSLGAQ